MRPVKTSRQGEVAVGIFFKYLFVRRGGGINLQGSVSAIFFFFFKVLGWEEFENYPPKALADDDLSRGLPSPLPRTQHGVKERQPVFSGSSLAFQETIVLPSQFSYF